MTWKTVGTAVPGLLSQATDFAHTNLGWEPTLGVLAGRGVGPQSLRAASVFEGLELAASSEGWRLATSF